MKNLKTYEDFDFDPSGRWFFPPQEPQKSDADVSQNIKSDVDTYGEEVWDEKDISDIIKDLNEYTDEEKIQKFDELYDVALTIFNATIEGRLGPEYAEYETHTWEDVMELLAKDKRKFWDYWNEIY